MLSCNICLNNRNLPKKKILTPHDIPDRPWEKVGVDVFIEFTKLSIVDYFNKIFEVIQLQNKTARQSRECQSFESDLFKTRHSDVDNI